MLPAPHSGELSAFLLQRVTGALVTPEQVRGCRPRQVSKQSHSPPEGRNSSLPLTDLPLHPPCANRDWAQHLTTGKGNSASRHRAFWPNSSSGAAGTDEQQSLQTKHINMLLQFKKPLWSPLYLSSNDANTWPHWAAGRQEGRLGSLLHMPRGVREPDIWWLLQGYLQKTP